MKIRITLEAWNGETLALVVESGENEAWPTNVITDDVKYIRADVEEQ